MLGEVASLDQPLIVLLEEEHAGESDQGLTVGVDADDVGAPADFFVDALEWVRGAQLEPLGNE
jgi:hypothetical protein